MTYSIIGILASMLLVIVNRDILWRINSKGFDVTRRNYRRFLLGVLAYLISDAFWGIFDSLKFTQAQYIDTAIYFIAMAAAIMLWARYVVSYLHTKNVFDRIINLTGQLFFAVELVAVVINFFKPILFWFDDAGGYHAGSFRYVTLFFQIFMFLVISAYTLYVTARSEGTVKLRHRTIGLFGIAMVVFIAIQIVYPLLPCYAMGYMLGTCLLHTFVVEDEKEEYRQELESSREALKDALDRAEYAGRAKTVFLNNMSHDIRTPMNAIIGFTTLAASHLDDKELVSDYLDKIEISGQHLLGLINDVLDMSRIESGKIELQEEGVDLKAMMQELEAITQSTAADKDLRVSMDISGVEHEHIIIDKLRLNQIMLNIISNAIKYTPEGGKIDISIKEGPCASPGYRTYELRVKDTGIGMSEDFRKIIFEAFTREQTSTASGIEGTGLGMSITKSIVDMMNGTISVESEVGKGSEFIVTLPVKLDEGVDEQGKKEETTTVLTKKDFEGKRILLAEDNEMNQTIAKAILEENGFKIDIVNNGEEAVAMVEDAPEGTYDIILMDIQMPKMNGYEASRAIRALDDKTKSSIPIVAVTANAFDEDRQEALNAGMNGHLAKPYDIPAMLEMLSKLL